MPVVDAIASWLVVVIVVEEEAEEEEEAEGDEDDDESVAKATNPEAESVGEGIVSEEKEEEFVAIALNPRLAGSVEDDEIMTERKVVDGGDGGDGIVLVLVSVAASAVTGVDISMDGDCVSGP